MNEPVTSEIERFEAWLAQRGQKLAVNQREAAIQLLAGLRPMTLRGAGRTFLLTAIDRFLDETREELVS